MKKTLFTLIALAAASQLSFGYSQKYFDKVDADQNGSLSKEEFVGGRAEDNKNNFAKRDADGSGVLEDGESGFHVNRDTDGNGSITLEEFITVMTDNDNRGFDLMDVDGNGSLDLDELNKKSLKKPKAE